MVFRNYFKCNICTSISFVRYPADDCSYPVRFTCCNCGSSMKGNVIVNDSVGSLKIEFDNCTEVDMEKPDYYFEVSNSLLAEKVRPFNAEEDEHNFSLWLKNLDLIGHDNYQKYAPRIKRFENLIENDWARIRNIIELYLNDKGSFIGNQIHQFLPEEQFPCNNDLEKMRAVHTLMVTNIARVLPSSFYDITCKFIQGEWVSFNRSKLSDYRVLVNKLEKNNYLQASEKKILKIINDFCIIFKNIEPSILLSLSDFKNYDDIKEKYGIAVCHFDDLKGFYLDSYEFLADTLIVIELHNNLKYRGDYNKFSGKKSVKSLDNYNKLSKGNRIKYGNQSEAFSSLVHEKLDNKLRNPIGHNNYEYDGRTQLITFKDNNKSNVDKELYLIEFALICYKNMISVINIAELIYNMRKMKFIAKGEQTVNSSVFKNMKPPKKNW